MRGDGFLGGGSVYADGRKWNSHIVCKSEFPKTRHNCLRRPLTYVLQEEYNRRQPETGRFQFMTKADAQLYAITGSVFSNKCYHSHSQLTLLQYWLFSGLVRLVHCQSSVADMAI